MHLIGCINWWQNIEILMSSNEIGAFVRVRRRAAGLTQAELGELAGVGRRFVSELEMAKQTVRLDAVTKVLAVFGKAVGIVDARREPLP